MAMPPRLKAIAITAAETVYAQFSGLSTSSHCQLLLHLVTAMSSAMDAISWPTSAFMLSALELVITAMDRVKGIYSVNRVRIGRQIPVPIPVADRGRKNLRGEKSPARCDPARLPRGKRASRSPSARSALSTRSFKNAPRARL